MKEALFNLRLNLAMTGLYLALALINLSLGTYALAVVMVVLTGLWAYVAKMWYDIYLLRRRMEGMK